MRIKISITAILLFLSSSIFAQDHEPTETQNSTGQSGTGANINVVYQRCNWTIDPRSGKNISGTVTTYFKTTQANVSTLNFDLNKNSFNNVSLVVTYHGTACTKSFPGSGAVNIVNITLPTTIVAINTLDSVSITYSGTPPGVSGAAQGYQAGGSGANRYINTLSESYEDRDWWPCKADMQDKIDSMDIIVNVPWVTATNDTFWVASNGILIDSAMTSSTTRRFIFKTHYPIASYLVAISVAKFTRYHRSVNINGTMTPVVYYLLANTTPANKSTKVATMDMINLVLVAFSNKFGDYPFKLEKHGFYDGLLGAGGMEHQTFSAIATSQFNVKTLTHELMHQWFGDNVTFSTWNDLWLAEGFARYSEALAGELVPSVGINAYSTLNGFKNSALSLNAASTWIPDSYMATSNLIWNSDYGSTVYERGCMVVSMLRALAGDTKFFKACTDYQTNMKGKSATTDSLKNYFNAELGTDISAFFDDYVGGSGKGTTAVGGIGNPINTVNWNSPSANKLYLQMGSQNKTAGSNVSYFRGPVVVHATNAASGWTKDTTITFFDWGGGNMSYAGNGLSAPTTLLYYNLSFTPTHLFYDDSARTLSTGNTFKLNTLAANVMDFSGHKTATGNQLSLSLLNTNPPIKIEIEKSINGIDFIIAGQMSQQTSNGQTVNFLFTDAFPYDGFTFYRAKLTYAIGTEITNIIKIESNKQCSILTITPNPAANEMKVAFNNTAKIETLLKIINADGKVIFETVTKKEIINYDVSGLANGIYMVSIIQNGAIVQSNKLIVKH